MQINEIKDFEENVHTRSAKLMVIKEAKIEARKLEIQCELKQAELACHPQISKKSQNLTRTVQDMISWDENRKKKLSDLKLKFEEEKKKEITGKPQINRNSNDICSSGRTNASVPFYERLLKYKEKSDKNLRDEIVKQELKARADANPVLIKPQIAHFSFTDTISRSDDVANRLYKIAEVQKRKLDKSIEEKKLKTKDTQGNTLFEPKLNTKSIALATASRPEHVPIQDILVYHGKLYEQKAHLREMQKIKNEEKLRKEATKLNSKSEKIVKEKSADVNNLSEVSSMFDQSSKDSLSVWEYANRLLKPTGVVKKSTIESINIPTFQPTINHISKKIAESSRGNINLSNGSSQRLLESFTRRIGNSQDYPEANANETNLNDSSPKPLGHDLFSASMNTLDTSDSQYMYPNDYNSFRIDRSLISTPGRFSLTESMTNFITRDEEDSINSSVFNRSQNWAKQKANRIERERQKRSQDQLKECSFKPTIRSKSAGLSRSAVTTNNESMMEKSNQWLMRREQKLSAERKKKEDSALDGCSFAPSLPKRSISLSKRNN